jgi:hypothetical protein
MDEGQAFAVRRPDGLSRIANETSGVTAVRIGDPELGLVCVADGPREDKPLAVRRDSGLVIGVIEGRVARDRA